jgi:hypothetical protein
LTRRIESPDVLVLLSCLAAAVLLVPLRGVLDAFPFVPFAAAFVLFMAPGVLLTCWLLKDDVSGWPSCRWGSRSARASSAFWGCLS